MIGLPNGETADDLRWYATHEALSRHRIFDVLMWLADQIDGDTLDCPRETCGIHPDQPPACNLCL